MKRHLISLTVLAVLLIAMTSVYAQDGNMRMRKFTDDDFPEFTAEQRGQMADLRADHQKAMIPLKADLRLKQLELKEMMRKDASQSMINSKLDEIGAIKTQISKMRVDHRLKTRALMTDEQREYFEEHRGMMGRHFKDGCGGDRRGKGDRMQRFDRGNFGGQRGDGNFQGRGDCFFNSSVDDNADEPDDSYFLGYDE